MLLYHKIKPGSAWLPDNLEHYTNFMLFRDDAVCLKFATPDSGATR